MQYAWVHYPGAGLAVVALAFSSFAQETIPEYPPQPLRDLMVLALQGNPDLQAAEMEAGAMHALGDHHGNWDAPDIGVEFYQAPIASFPNPLRDQMEIDYSVQQSVPWPGKLTSLAEPMHLRGQALEMKTKTEAMALARALGGAYAQWITAWGRLRINRDAGRDAQTLLAGARTRYEAGEGIQAEVLQAEGELAELEGEAVELEAQAENARGVLARLINLPSDSLSRRLGDTAMEWHPRPLPGGLDSLKKTALERHPELESMRLSVDAEAAEIVSRKKAIWPDVMVRGMYKDRLETTRDDWSLMIGFKATWVPWNLTAWRASVREAEAARRREEWKLASNRLAVTQAVEKSYTDVQSAWRRLNLLEKRRLPLAEQALRSSLTAFANGRANLSLALLSFREARKVREEALLVKAEHLLALSDLAYAVGWDPYQVTADKNPGKEALP